MPIQADFSGWTGFSHEIAEMRGALPEDQLGFFEGLGSDIVRNVQRDYNTVPLIGNSRPMRYTGRYGEAFTFQTLGNPMGVAIGFRHTQDRLPIYWRTMETGSKPGVVGNFYRIMHWARTKAGVSTRSVMESIIAFGVRPQKLLGRYFIFSPGLAVPMGVTSRTTVIIEARLRQFVTRWGSNWGVSAGQGRVFRGSPTSSAGRRKFSSQGRGFFGGGP